MVTERSQGVAVSGGGGGAFDKDGILARSPLACLVGPSRAALLGLATAERRPRRYELAREGQPPRAIVLIGSGRVKLERARAGKEVLLGHRGPGDLVCEAALAGADTALESATVVDEAIVLEVALDALRARLARDAALRLAVSAAIVRQHRSLQRRLQGLLLDGVEARLIGFIVDALAHWGAPTAAGLLLTAAFTHAEIALVIGSTRETVTLVLGKLKRLGFISFERRRIVVRDVSELERFGRGQA